MEPAKSIAGFWPHPADPNQPNFIGSTFKDHEGSRRDTRCVHSTVRFDNVVSQLLCVAHFDCSLRSQLQAFGHTRRTLTSPILSAPPSRIMKAAAETRDSSTQQYASIMPSLSSSLEHMLSGAGEVNCRLLATPGGP